MNQFRIGRKPAFDFLSRRRALTAEAVDPVADRSQLIIVPLLWRKRQCVVKRIQLCADLLLKVLFLSSQLRQFRIIRGRSGGRAGNRILNGLPPDQIGEPQGICGSACSILFGLCGRSRQHRNVGFNDNSGIIVSRCGTGAVFVNAGR